jgi:hypothetical protein
LQWNLRRIAAPVGQRFITFGDPVWLVEPPAEELDPMLRRVQAAVLEDLTR